MAEEIEWREGDEDGKQIAEVNGWTVEIKPSVTYFREWHYRILAACPTCGAAEGMGGGLRHTRIGAQAEGIAIARSCRPKCARRGRS